MWLRPIHTHRDDAGVLCRRCGRRHWERAITRPFRSWRCPHCDLVFCGICLPPHYEHFKQLVFSSNLTGRPCAFICFCCVSAPSRSPPPFVAGPEIGFHSRRWGGEAPHLLLPGRRSGSIPKGGGRSPPPFVAGPEIGFGMGFRKVGMSVGRSVCRVELKEDRTMMLGRWLGGRLPADAVSLVARFGAPREFP